MDGSGGISAQELSRIAEGLGTIIPSVRLEEALAKLGWIALRDVKGEVDSVTFEAWWKEYMEPFFEGDFPRADDQDLGGWGRVGETEDGKRWPVGGSDEARMTVKDGVRRGMRVKQLAKVSLSPPSLSRSLLFPLYIMATFTKPTYTKPQTGIKAVSRSKFNQRRCLPSSPRRRRLA